MPMPEVLARLVPPGTPPRKLACAGLLVLAALGSVAYNLLAWNDGAAAEAMALDADGDGWVDEDLPPQATAAPHAPDAPAARPEPPAASWPADRADAPAAEPAAPGAQPDWAALFEMVLARAEAQDGDEPAPLRLDGLVTGADGGTALIDGRCLRPGDALPGTRYVLAEVRADRVLLDAPGRAAALELLLEAPGAR